MEKFTNRYTKRYRLKLKNILTLDNLIETSEKIEDEEVSIEGYNCDRICSIDFTGISATTLFDTSGEFNDVNKESSFAFEQIIKHREKLNKIGIALKIRILFLYPYSNYSLARVQAEYEDERPVMSDSSIFDRGFEEMKSINRKMFDGSTLVKNQEAALRQIQRIKKKYKILSYGANSLRVRFTTIGTSLCTLIVNNIAFFDTYVLAKEEPLSRKLFSGLPLISINKKIKNDKIYYQALKNHFRYLWTLNTTLDCEDATFFDKEKNTGLEKLREPKEINFQGKAETIIKRNPNLQFELDDIEDIINHWKMSVSYIFRKQIQDFAITPSKEKIFITCSWKKNSENGRELPKAYATIIESQLQEDFNDVAEINLLKAPYGEKLDSSIYNNLHSSTMAIIFLTKDIEGKDGVFYSKPNIYHEIGFFSKHFAGENRLFILKERGVYTPSNIANITSLEFTSDTFKDIYYDLLEWFSTTNCFITTKYINRAKYNYKNGKKDTLAWKNFIPKH